MEERLIVLELDGLLRTIRWIFRAITIFIVDPMCGHEFRFPEVAGKYALSLAATWHRFLLILWIA